MKFNHFRSMAGAAILLLGAVPPGLAQPAPSQLDVLAGKTIRIIIGSDAGGGTDSYARAFGHALEAELTRSTVVLQNVPAGNGAIALLEAEEARSDNNVVTLVVTHSTPIYSQMFGANTAVSDLLRFHWIGALTNNQRIAAVRASLAAATVPSIGALDRQVMIPTDFTNSPSEVEASLLGAATDLHVRVVVGVEDDLRTALILAGDADLLVNSYYSLKPLVDAGAIVPLLRFGTRGYPAELDPVPTLAEVADPGTPRELVALLDDLNNIGRLVSAAPSTSPDVVAALRLAFDRAAATPGLAAEYASRGLVLATTPGDEVALVVDRLLADPRTRDVLAAYLTCGREETAGPELDCSAP